MIVRPIIGPPAMATHAVIFHHHAPCGTAEGIDVVDHDPTRHPPGRHGFGTAASDGSQKQARQDQRRCAAGRSEIARPGDTHSAIAQGP
jgi:hypothetical protein